MLARSCHLLVICCLWLQTYSAGPHFYELFAIISQPRHRDQHNKESRRRQGRPHSAGCCASPANAGLPPALPRQPRLIPSAWVSVPRLPAKAQGQSTASLTDLV